MYNGVFWNFLPIGTSISQTCRLPLNNAAKHPVGIDAATALLLLLILDSTEIVSQCLNVFPTPGKPSTKTSREGGHSQIKLY